LHDEPELAEEMGRAGRARMLEHLTWEKKFDYFDGIYKKIL